MDHAHQGWTPATKAAFIDALAASGEVLAAVKTVGLSPQSAYRHRARDPEFARAWASARMISREVVIEELHSRALHGWDEDVFFRGEVVGTRKRHDNRLLLALLARLDNFAGQEDVTIARRARDCFGRLVETLAAGQPTDDCYPASQADRENEAIAAAARRHRFGHYSPMMTAAERAYIQFESQNDDSDDDYNEEDYRRDLAADEMHEQDGQDEDEDENEHADDEERSDDRADEGDSIAAPPAEQLSAPRGCHSVSPLAPVEAMDRPAPGALSDEQAAGDWCNFEGRLDALHCALHGDVGPTPLSDNARAYLAQNTIPAPPDEDEQGTGPSIRSL